MENNETTQAEDVIFTEVMQSLSDQNTVTFIDGDEYAYTIGLDQTGA